MTKPNGNSCWALALAGHGGKNVQSANFQNCKRIKFSSKITNTKCQVFNLLRDVRT